MKNQSVPLIDTHLFTDDQLIEYVYSIIDSKTQYIEYQLNQAIQSNYVDPTQSHRAPDIEASIPHASSFASDNNKALLLQLEESTKVINRLLFLRTILTKLNAQRIYDLITSSYYVEFSPKELQILVEGKNAKDNSTSP